VLHIYTYITTIHIVTVSELETSAGEVMKGAYKYADELLGERHPAWAEFGGTTACSILMVYEGGEERERGGGGGGLNINILHVVWMIYYWR
jgi:hypothetical protein